MGTWASFPRNLLLVAAAAALLAPGRVAAQTTIPENTIQVSAEGQAKADPDTAEVSFLVTGEETELRYAYAKAQAQADQVRELLRSQGFSPESAQIGTYNVQPNLDPRSRRVIDYTVAAAITLDVTDFTKLGPLLDAAGASGLTALRGVSFLLKNQDAAKSAAIADGYRQVRQEAEALAAAAGLKLAGLDYASVDVSLPSPIPFHVFANLGSEAGPSAPPTGEFTPREITVTARINAVYRVHD